MFVRSGWVTLTALMLAGACDGDSQEPADLEQGLSPGELRLLASPTALRLAERGAFRAGIELRNPTSEPIVPAIDATNCVLSVDGEQATVWGLALTDGTRNPYWFELPPGAVLVTQWPLGDALFQHTGRYQLSLHCQEQTSVVEVSVVD